MPSLTLFHRFPNELLYEVFQYLTTYDILRAFHGINRRINTILSNHAKYDLNFESWPKSKFDFVCQLIGPEQVRSLLLSDADDTVRQIHLFFRLLYIRRFVHLQSFTLIDVTEQDWKKISANLHYLTHLSHLSIKSVDNVLPQTIPSSLKHLSIGICSMNRLHQWLLCAPGLVNLEAELIGDASPSSSAFRSTPISTNIRRLKVQLPAHSNITFDEIELLFACMPKLRQLTFIAAGGFRVVRAEQWEQLMRTYLPRLKHFRFRLHPCLPNTNVRQLLDTFETPFWLQEHHWRVHCDHHRVQHIASRNVKDVHLYTLPYSSEQFHLSSSTEALTTIRKDEYATIRHLYLSIDAPWHPSIAERYYFPHLESLTISNLHKLIPMGDVIDLSQIKHLTLEKSNVIHSEEFFTQILGHSRSLRSLKVSWHRLVEITDNFADQQVCTFLQRQIKCLDVFDVIPDDDKNTPKPIECLMKTFATNLEKLNLQVTSLDTILMLLNRMVQLQSIKMEYTATEARMSNDELLSWLMRNVPRLKNFTYQVRPAVETRCCLLLWIGQ